MIIYQRIQLKFSQLLFYISYKSCKHSLISFHFFASVYELFDNPSYIDRQEENTYSIWWLMKCTILVHPSLVIITMYLVCLINALESREKDFKKCIFTIRLIWSRPSTSHCSMAMSGEHRLKICSPSPAMVISLYGWNSRVGR